MDGISTVEVVRTMFKCLCILILHRIISIVNLYSSKPGNLTSENMDVESSQDTGSLLNCTFLRCQRLITWMSAVLVRLPCIPAWTTSIYPKHGENDSLRIQTSGHE